MPDNENPILKYSNSNFSDLFTKTSSLNQTQRRRNLIQLDHQERYTDYSNLFDTEIIHDQNDYHHHHLNFNQNKFNTNQIPFQLHKINQDEEEEKMDSNEIFDLIRSITDPEHPLTLEDLSVVSTEQISVTYPEDPESSPHVMVRFTPTIPHCSMATLIGLTLRVRLLRSLPQRFKVDIKIKEGTHQSENSVNKQLNDKERVAAALENNHLLGVVEQCLKTAHLRGSKQESTQ